MNENLITVEETWNIARRICTDCKNHFPSNELKTIFGTSDWCYIMNTNSAEQAKEKIQKWQNELKELFGTSDWHHIMNTNLAEQAKEKIQNSISTDRIQRTLLVKAKLKDNSKWIEGYYLNENKIHNIVGDCNIYEIVPNTLCHCTGKEYMDSQIAYEGDIFESQVSGDIMILRFGTYQAFCPVDEDYMDSVGFFAECEGMPDMPIGDLKEYALKKGNIFDNPELLNSH